MKGTTGKLAGGFRLSKNLGELERVKTLSNYNRAQRRVRWARGDFCEGKSYFPRAKIATLQAPRPRISKKS